MDKNDRNIILETDADVTKCRRNLVKSQVKRGKKNWFKYMKEILTISKRKTTLTKNDVSTNIWPNTLNIILRNYKYNIWHFWKLSNGHNQLWKTILTLPSRQEKISKKKPLTTPPPLSSTFGAKNSEFKKKKLFKRISYFNICQQPNFIRWI